MLMMRLATQDDAKELFEWRNDPITREQSMNSDEVSFESHKDWLKNSLENPNRHLFIFEDDQKNPVGTGRTDWKDGRFELSWTVSPMSRKKGYGKQIVSSLSTRFFPCTAIVKSSNDPSKMIAESCGFSKVSEDRGVIRYELDYPNRFKGELSEGIEIINQIEKTRTKNNINWMDILRIAYVNDPEQTKKVLRKIHASDSAISDLVEKLSE